jgi:hypothetical protein
VDCGFHRDRQTVINGTPFAHAAWNRILDCCFNLATVPERKISIILHY